MVFLLQKIIRTIIFMYFESFSFVERVGAEATEWRPLEMLAEEHPYIVALLDDRKQYTCTGTIISKRTVVTSGECVESRPSYIAVAAAVLGGPTAHRNLLEVADTLLHEEYTFDLRSGEHNATTVFSNIGLVITLKPDLEYFVEAAEIGDLLTSDLKEKILTVVGYSVLWKGKGVILQRQDYYQTPCSNPKWYYVVCGIEVRTTRSHDSMSSIPSEEYGRGAPVLYGTKVVGITAAPCGSLTKPGGNIKYNIFTIIGPYLPWIANYKYKPALRAANTNPPPPLEITQEEKKESASFSYRKEFVNYIPIIIFMIYLIN